MSHVNTNYFKDKILSSLKLLSETAEVASLTSEIVELDQTKVGRLSRIDALQSQSMSKELEHRRSIQEKQLKLALKNIQSGIFGYCLDCTNEISLARLEINPTVSLCIECAQEKEKRF